MSAKKKEVLAMLSPKAEREEIDMLLIGKVLKPKKYSSDKKKSETKIPVKLSPKSRNSNKRKNHKPTINYKRC